jgi:hypothetical protein
MKRLALSILSASAVAVGAAGLAAPSASALVNYCSGLASPGCNTFFGGQRSYVDTYSSKASGDNPAEICTRLRGDAGIVVSGCANWAMYVRRCYSGLTLVYGEHWGSSSSWTVDGRDATTSDSAGC